MEFTQEQQEIIREIIREEMNKFDFSDRFMIYKTMQFLDGRNIKLGNSNGTKIGTEITQKIGFWNVSPISQRSGSAQASVITTASTQTTPFGYATQAQADAIVTLVNELRAALVAIGIIKGSS